jgi:hypothetical protein
MCAHPPALLLLAAIVDCTAVGILNGCSWGSAGAKKSHPPPLPPTRSAQMRLHTHASTCAGTHTCMRAHMWAHADVYVYIYIPCMQRGTPAHVPSDPCAHVCTCMRTGIAHQKTSMQSWACVHGCDIQHYGNTHMHQHIVLYITSTHACPCLHARALMCNACVHAGANMCTWVRRCMCSTCARVPDCMRACTFIWASPCAYLYMCRLSCGMRCRSLAYSLLAFSM